MDSQTKSTPRDVFMHLFSIILLYISAVSFTTILFQLINTAIKDPLNPFINESAMRWAIASLVVVFPIFIWASRFIRKDMGLHPEKENLRIRKWLLYFTLFASAGFIIGDLISLIFRFLEGEITTRFILKITSILVVAASVFWYYLQELRHGEKTESKNRSLFAKLIIILVAATLVGGFLSAGSPVKERLLRFDDQRVNDLSIIQQQIVYSYWSPKGSLPSTLDDLRDSISGFVPPRDPETGESYEYRPINNLSFELCAVFNLPSRENSYDNPYPVYPKARGLLNETWDHSAGRFCFEQTIDPDIYKPKEISP